MPALSKPLEISCISEKKETKNCYVQEQPSSAGDTHIRGQNPKSNKNNLREKLQ